MKTILVLFNRFGFLLLLLFFTNTVTIKAQENVKVYQVKQLQYDFKQLRKHYECSLANCYYYTGKNKIDLWFDSMYALIRPMNGMEFYQFITPIAEQLKDGHSYILPAQKDLELIAATQLVFPFDVKWTSDRLIITANYSSDTCIQIGSAIQAINGIAIDSILKQMIKHLPRDGNNLAYPHWLSTTYFRAYYGYFWGYPKSFQLTVILPNNHQLDKRVGAILKSQLNTLQVNLEPEFGIQTHIDTLNKTAVVKIKTWDNQLLKKSYHQDFKALTAEFMQQVCTSNITELVIDLRDNQGGDFHNGIFLLGYLVDQPFYYLKSISKRKRGSELTMQQVRRYNRFCRLNSVNSLHYSGHITVLVNGGSFSNSAIFCEALQRNREVQFIGSCGGNGKILSGVFDWRNEIKLHFTKIRVANANHQIITN